MKLNITCLIYVIPDNVLRYLKRKQQNKGTKLFITNSGIKWILSANERFGDVFIVDTCLKL